MLVKTLFNMQPAEHSADSLVLHDDMGNPIFVAMHMSDGIVYSDVTQKDFPGLLKLISCDAAPTVTVLDN